MAVVHDPSDARSAILPRGVSTTEAASTRDHLPASSNSFIVRVQLALPLRCLRGISVIRAPPARFGGGLF